MALLLSGRWLRGILSKASLPHKRGAQNSVQPLKDNSESFGESKIDKVILLRQGYGATG
jgi:hypothetical protein